MKKSVREEIANTVAETPVINHHEHAWQSFSAEYGQVYDLPHFLFNDYLGGDLASAGYGFGSDLVDYLGNPILPEDTQEAWDAIRPYLDKVRSTSYFRYMLRCLEDLFEVAEEDLFSERWRDVSERIEAYSQKHIGKGGELCTKMGVTATVLDGKLEANMFARLDAGDHKLIHIARMDMFIHEERGLLQTMKECPTQDFEEWLGHFDTRFRHFLDAGATGFKSGLAYNRPIAYSEPTKDVAAKIFENGLLEASPAEKTIYQDYMMNLLCQRCIEAGMPLQIHSGIQAGIGHILEDTRPTLLNGLFRRFPELRVDLFHGGHPWVEQAGLMAKYFPNVYIDGCWLMHISPSTYRRALTSWIETVPMNKIFAWGGDHSILEHSCASLILARDLIADVLTDLVERGYFDLELALQVAKRILHNNGAEFWHIDT
jgi:uncharacterized protein